jgi:hypothetical protein
MRDEARRAWYARHRHRRFARFLGFGDPARPAASPQAAGAGRREHTPPATHGE